MAPGITRTTNLLELVREHPGAAELLFRRGIHCVGCMAAQFETIEQGLRGHGLSDEQIDAFIKELNELDEKPVELVSGITITPAAIAELKRLLAEKQLEAGLRIDAVQKEGGVAYGFNLEHERREDDTVVERDGVTFYLSSESIGQLRGAKIDFLSFPQPGFKIVR